MALPFSCSYSPVYHKRPTKPRKEEHPPSIPDWQCASVCLPVGVGSVPTQFSSNARTSMGGREITGLLFPFECRVWSMWKYMRSTAYFAHVFDHTRDPAAFDPQVDCKHFSLMLVDCGGGINSQLRPSRPDPWTSG